MSFCKSSLLLVGLLTGLSFVSADEERAAPSQNDAAAKESAARLRVMKQRALSVSVESKAEPEKPRPAKIIETPLLRYSNQAAQIITADATVWAWGQTGRPVAMASLDDTGFEIVSLVESPVSLTGKSGVKWDSQKSEILWNVVPDAPSPADSAVLRARQMKDIGKRFTAAGHYGMESGAYQLRFLERYLHRYADSEQGIVDGAIYAFAAGTNPEVILLLECRESSSKKRQWYYGLTRLSAGRLEANLDERHVWSCPAIVTWNAREAYWSGPFGKEDVVPEIDLQPGK